MGRSARIGCGEDGGIIPKLIAPLKTGQWLPFPGVGANFGQQDSFFSRPTPPRNFVLTPSRWNDLFATEAIQPGEVKLEMPAGIVRGRFRWGGDSSSVCVGVDSITLIGRVFGKNIGHCSVASFATGGSESTSFASVRRSSAIAATRSFSTIAACCGSRARLFSSSGSASKS